MADQSQPYPSVTAELTDYWNRRPNLSEKEWTRFYVLVRGTLMNASAPQLASLPERRETYIAEFFQDKFLYTTPKSEHDLMEGQFAISSGTTAGQDQGLAQYRSDLDLRRR